MRFRLLGSSGVIALGLFSAMVLTQGRSAEAQLPSQCACIDGTGGALDCQSGEVAAVQCLYESSVLPLSIPSWRQSISAALNGQAVVSDSRVVIEAWGGLGGNPLNASCPSGQRNGAPGPMGYARTTQDLTELTLRTEFSRLRLYVGARGPTSNRRGGRGASSSIVVGQELTSVGNPSNPNGQMFFAIGAGGGGSGRCDDVSGGDGGAGGCAISVAGSPAEPATASCVVADDTAASAPGEDGRNQGGSGAGGRGGNADGAGTGGSRGSDRQGANGAGGFGGRNVNDNGWVGWIGSSLTQSDYPVGAGGRAEAENTNHQLGGGGGGGFGGGAGGDGLVGCFLCFNGRGQGGGGGGAWSRLALFEEIGLPFIGQTNFSGPNGLIALTVEVKDLDVFGPAPLRPDSLVLRAKRAGSRNANGKIVLKGSFPLDHPMDLSESFVSLVHILENAEGEEMVRGESGSALPATALQPHRNARSDRSLYRIEEDGVRIKALLENSGDQLLVRLMVDGARIEPVACARGGTPPLRTRLLIDDGVNEGLELLLEEPWACESKGRSGRQDLTLVLP